MAEAVFDMVESAVERLTLTVRIKRMREFSIRMQIMLACMRVAGWVSPVPLELEMVDRDEA